MNYTLANDIKVTLNELGIPATLVLGKNINPTYAVVRRLEPTDTIRFGVIINGTTFFREGDIIAEFSDED